ncbi:hypothetical protein N2152v2_005682 [Parachlorella kessleri]
MADFGLANCLQTATNKLVFPVKVNQESESRFTLTNPTNARIGYKVKTTAPKSYSVKPAAGILEPGAECTATVTRVAATKLPAPGEKCKDKFRVEALTMPPGVATVSSELFQVYKGHVVVTNIKVALIAAQHTPLAGPLPRLPQTEPAGRSAAPAAAPAAPEAAKTLQGQDSPDPVETAPAVANMLCSLKAGLAGTPEAAAVRGTGSIQATSAAGAREGPAALPAAAPPPRPAAAAAVPAASAAGLQPPKPAARPAATAILAAGAPAEGAAALQQPRPAAAAATHPAMAAAPVGGATAAPAAAPAANAAGLQPPRPGSAASKAKSKAVRSGHARARVGRGSGSMAAHPAAVKKAGASVGVIHAGICSGDLVLGPGDPGFDGDQYVGRAVHKLFSDGKMYTGVVTEFIPRKKWFNIKYEDSDSEDIFWEELKSILQPTQNSISPASPQRAEPAAARPTGPAQTAAQAAAIGVAEDSGGTPAAQLSSGGMQAPSNSQGTPAAVGAAAAAGRGGGNGATATAAPPPASSPAPVGTAMPSSAADKVGAATPWLPAEPGHQTPLPPSKPAAPAEPTPAADLASGLAAAEDMVAPAAAGPTAAAGATPVGGETAQQAGAGEATPMVAGAPASELSSLSWSVRRPRTEGTRRRRARMEPLAAAVEKLAALREEEPTPSPETTALAEGPHEFPAHQLAPQGTVQENTAARKATLSALIERQKERQQLLRPGEAEGQPKGAAKPGRQRRRLWRGEEESDEDWVPPEGLEEELPIEEGQRKPTAAAAGGPGSKSVKEAPGDPWTFAKRNAAEQQRSGGSLPQPKPAKSGPTPVAVAAVAVESEVIDLVDSDDEEGQTLAARSAQRAQQAHQQQHRTPELAAVKREPGLGKTPGSRVQQLLRQEDDAGLGGGEGGAAKLSGASRTILTCTQKGNAAKRAKLAVAAGMGEGSLATTVDMRRDDSGTRPAVSQATTLAAGGSLHTPAATARALPSHQRSRRSLRTKAQLRQAPQQLLSDPTSSQPLGLSVRTEGGKILMTVRVKPTTQLAKLLAAVERAVGEEVRAEAGWGPGAALRFRVGALELAAEGERLVRVRDVGLEDVQITELYPEGDSWFSRGFNAEAYKTTRLRLESCCKKLSQGLRDQPWPEVRVDNRTATELTFLEAHHDPALSWKLPAQRQTLEIGQLSRYLPALTRLSCYHLSGVKELSTALPALRKLRVEDLSLQVLHLNQLGGPLPGLTRLWCRSMGDVEQLSRSLLALEYLYCQETLHLNRLGGPLPALTELTCGSLSVPKQLSVELLPALRVLCCCGRVGIGKLNGLSGAMLALVELRCKALSLGWCSASFPAPKKLHCSGQLNLGTSSASFPALVSIFCEWLDLRQYSGSLPALTELVVQNWFEGTELGLDTVSPALQRLFLGPDCGRWIARRVLLPPGITTLQCPASLFPGPGSALIKQLERVSLWGVERELPEALEAAARLEKLKISVSVELSDHALSMLNLLKCKHSLKEVDMWPVSERRYFRDGSF